MGHILLLHTKECVPKEDLRSRMRGFAELEAKIGSQGNFQTRSPQNVLRLNKCLGIPALLKHGTHSQLRDLPSLGLMDTQ